MATTIKLKNGSGAPLAGDLVQGEPALDLTNKRLYTEDSGGTVIEVGTNPTSLTTGTFTSTGIDDNATSTAITINSSQNVGIGTASPNAYANYTTLTLNGATSSAIDFEGGGTLMAEVFSTANDLVLQTTNSDGELIFKSAAGIEAARINSSGNVGIGTTSPTVRLQIGDATVNTSNILKFGKTQTAAQSTLPYIRQVSESVAGTSNDLELFAGGSGAGRIILNSYDFVVKTGGGTTPSGAERMRIDSSGNLLVGKTSTAFGTAGVEASAGNGLWSTRSSLPPLALNRLSTDGSIVDFYKDGALVGSIGSNNSAGTPVLDIGANSSSGIMRMLTSGTERMRIDSSGNVGIGTASPVESSGYNSLTINDTTSGYLALQSAGSTKMEAYVSGGTEATLRGTGVPLALTTTAAHDITFDTNAAERMRINSSGNVGIGTASPSAKLHVIEATSTPAVKIKSGTSSNQNTHITMFNDNDGGTLALGVFGSTATTFGTITAADAFISSNQELALNSQNASGAIKFGVGTSNTERMRIDSNGLLLAGVTSSTYHTFSLNNSGNYAAGVVNTNATNPYGLVISLSGVSSGGGAGFLTCVDANANRLLIRGDGDVENVNNSYGAISDERVKSNIVDASSQIDDIMAVQVRSYTLNETGETHIGVVAQELEASGMSGLVQEDEEGMKSVKYSILYMKAIKALQEAVTRIETLEAEVAALKGA